MDRKKRLELNRIAPCFQGWKNIIEWFVDENEVLWVRTHKYTYSAKKYFGNYGFITRHC